MDNTGLQQTNVEITTITSDKSVTSDIQIQ